MSNGIERLAWALHTYRRERGFTDGAPWDQEPDDIKSLYVGSATAVLTALRDECGTNEGMIEAGVMAMGSIPHLPGFYADTRDALQAALDHLLAPETRI